MEEHTMEMTTPNQSSFESLFLWIRLAVEYMLFYTIHSLSDGTSVRVAVEIFAGEEPKLWNCFQHALRCFCSLFTACVLLSWLLLVPAVLMIIVIIIVGVNENYEALAMSIMLFGVVYISYAVYITVITYHTYPVIIVEGEGGIDGIRRSVGLNKGQFCYVFMVLFLWWLLRCIVNTLVTSIMQHFQQGHDQEAEDTDGVSADLTFGSVGDSLLSVVLAILFAALGSM